MIQKVLLAIFILSGILTAQAQEYKLFKTLTGHTGGVQNLRFSPDGKLLVSAGQDGQIIFWDVQSGKNIRTIKAHSQTVSEVTFSKDGRLLATAGQEGTAKVWDVKTGKPLNTFQNKAFLIANPIIQANNTVIQDTIRHVGVSFVVFSPDSKFLYFSGDNGYIMKGDLKTGKAKSIYSTNFANGNWYSTVTGGTISTDEKNLVVTVGQYVKFINLRTEGLDREFYYGEDYLNDVVNGPFNYSVATWCYDGKVLFWNARTGVVLARYPVADKENYSAASFSKDGKYMVTSAAGKVARVWDLSNGRLIATLQGHSRIVRLSRFSPTENLIATGSYDQTVRLWKEQKDEPLVASAKPAVNPVTDNAAKNQPREATTVKEPAKTEPPALKFNNEVVTVGKTIPLNSLQFEQSSYLLMSASYKELDKLAAFLRDNPRMEIEIHGHTDNVGDQAKNLKLSERRVVAVEYYLIGKGVDEKRIQTRAFGGTVPISDNTTEEGRRKNRRVEIKFLKM